MTDNEMITRNAEEGWRTFCWFSAFGTVAVVAILVLMAIFLV